MLTKVMVVAAAAATLVMAAPAVAGELDAPTRAVSLANVDFHDGQQAAAFYGQLQAAAAEVCDTNSVNPRITQGDELCARKVLAKTVYAMNQPVLTAMLEASHGHPQLLARR